VGNSIAILLALAFCTARATVHRKISNFKHQITNKSQIPILNDQNKFGIWNFGHCDLFDIWDL
jgi:hypothetical protein